jgi:hypothetical protein
VKASTRTLERLRRIRSFGVSLCAIVLLGSAAGRADEYVCVPPEIAVFPPPGEIPSNAVFVLQGVGKAGETIRSLSASDVVFHRKGVDIRARILSRGDGTSSNLVLAPLEGQLLAGPIELRIFRPPVGQESPWKSAGSWTVSSASDRTVPDFDGSESTASMTRVETFDERIHVDFSVGSTESPVLLLASVEEAEDEIPTGKREDLFLFPNKHYLYRGPCGRNHALERGRQYLVDLVPVDAAGNRGRKTGDVFVIDVP